ncbi:MAG: aspartate-alanine antiporter [Opitutaceae bacterium]|nr:aspartate-alanine antiporter [Opitutaceae bacterium]
MIDTLRHLFASAPELALFLALALGHALGRVKLGRFSLGGVAASLLVALVIGQSGVVLPDALKAVCFGLFIYAVGFKSGPEFFGGLNRSSLKLVLAAVIHCVVALVTIVVLARLFDLGKGFAAGVGAGALTQTAMLGTAGDALRRMGFSAEEVGRFSSEMAVGFAITYVFGTVGVILFLRSVVPRLLGIDVRKAARELEAQLAEGGAVARPGLIAAFAPITARAFEVEAGRAAGKTLGVVLHGIERAAVERVVRGDQALGPDPGLVLEAGDLVGVAGRLASVLDAGGRLGPEVESREALSFPMKAMTIVITDRRVCGRTLGEIRDYLGREGVAGVYVSNCKRQGFELPLFLHNEVRRGDVFELIGRPDQVEKVTSLIGHAEADTDRSDLVYHTLGIAAGTLLGLIVVPVAGIPVTLGVGGGVLLSGLVFGWWHVRRPAAGAMPGATQWFLSEFGLSAFAAATGLSAGPAAIAAIQTHGLTLLFVGFAVTLVPIIAAYLVGHYVFRLHPAILLGALAGGQTVAAGLNAATDEAESVTPVLGFTVTYAISNVLLAVWGPLIVALT